MEVSKNIESTKADDVNRWSLSTDNSIILDGGGYSQKKRVSLEEKREKTNEIFDVENKYMQQRATPPTPKSFNMSTKLHTEQFLEVMEAYQGSLKDPSIHALNLRGKHSWDDVLRVAKDAEATYLAASGLRKAGRFITNNSEAVLPYLELIPNGFYTSMLCGALKLVFQITAARISEKRGEVLGTLLRIPNVIAQAERYVEFFPSDPVLYDRAADLYIAALAAIEGTIGSLMQKPAWKQVRAMMQGPLYTKSFKEKIEALNEALDSLQERVSTLRDGAIIRTEKTVQRVETVLDKVESSSEVVESTTKATLQHVHVLSSSAEQTTSAVSSMTQELKILKISQDETHLKLDRMMIALEETTKTSEWMRKNDRASRRLKRQMEQLEMVAAALSQEDLLDILGVKADASIQDLQKLIRAGLSAELSTIHVAQGITESEKFRGWMSTDASATLFIEDRSSSASSGRSTPMSLMSSMVIETLHNKEPAIPIYFFCGSHTSSKDSSRGPQGMMRSLICQILWLFKVELDFIQSRRYRTKLESSDLHTICDCFVKLVGKLPMDVVLVCVIDSICYFENKEWAENCFHAINELQDLAKDDEQGPVFKLLITSPLRSSIGVMLPPQCRITLAAEDLKGRDGPTERQISMRSRRPVRSRESDYRDW